MPHFSQSGSPGRRPCLRSAFCSSARDFVVGDRDALPPTAVLTVQAHDGMGSGAGAGEEIEDYCVGLVLDEESKGVFDRVEGLRERESASGKKRLREVRCRMRERHALSGSTASWAQYVRACRQT